MDTVISQVRDREWVEPQLADAAPVAEFAAPVDPMRAVLRTAGLHYALTRLNPLRQLLDDLTCAPDTVTAHADLWHSIAADLHQLSVLLRDCVEDDLPPGHRDASGPGWP